MVYSKISIDRVIAANPTLNIGDMVSLAVLDHEAANGCEFEPDAAARAVQATGLDPDGPAADLPEEMRAELGHTLEAMETRCASRGE